MSSFSLAVQVARETLKAPPRPNSPADFADVEIGRQNLLDMLADVRKLEGTAEPDLLGDALMLMVCRLIFDDRGREMILCGIFRELQDFVRKQGSAEASYG